MGTGEEGDQRKSSKEITIGGLIAAGTILVLGVFAAVLWKASPPSSGLDSYLAWLGAAAGIALLGRAVADLMKLITSNGEWAIVAESTKVFAAFWALVVSLAATAI